MVKATAERERNECELAVGRKRAIDNGCGIQESLTYRVNVICHKGVRKDKRGESDKENGSEHISVERRWEKGKLGAV